MRDFPVPHEHKPLHGSLKDRMEQAKHLYKMYDGDTYKLIYATLVRRLHDMREINKNKHQVGKI